MVKIIGVRLIFGEEACVGAVEVLANLIAKEGGFLASPMGVSVDETAKSSCPISKDAWKSPFLLNEHVFKLGRVSMVVESGNIDLLMRWMGGLISRGKLDVALDYMGDIAGKRGSSVSLFHCKSFWRRSSVGTMVFVSKGFFTKSGEINVRVKTVGHDGVFSPAEWDHMMRSPHWYPLLFYREVGDDFSTRLLDGMADKGWLVSAGRKGRFSVFGDDQKQFVVDMYHSGKCEAYPAKPIAYACGMELEMMVPKDCVPECLDDIVFRTSVLREAAALWDIQKAERCRDMSVSEEVVVERRPRRKAAIEADAQRAAILIASDLDDKEEDTPLRVEERAEVEEGAEVDEGAEVKGGMDRFRVLVAHTVFVRETEIRIAGVKRGRDDIPYTGEKRSRS